MDNRERDGRVELAAAFRIAARLGMHEGICNHFSLALTDDGREFLVNPHGYQFGELRARDLLRVEAGGRVLSGEGEVEPSALFIHGRMHLARPELRCILHTHMPYATALTSIESGRLEPINQNALRFVGQIAYDDDYGGLALDAGEGDRIAAALTDKRILFLANHGVITVGPSVAAAFDDLYYLERACRNQVLAMATGRPLKRVPDDEAGRTSAEFASYQNQAELHFAAQRRLLAREAPDYAD
jgi:ribulose-5-phosphate 4-epimerase/fuculose-1-phosphate aldolase